MSSRFCSPHLSSSFISFALLLPSLPPALLSCLLVLLPYTVSQSPQLVFAPRFVRTRSAPSFISSRLSLRTHFFPLPPLFPRSPVFTPSICLITRSSPLSLFSLFVFPSRLLFLTSYPSSLFVPPPPMCYPFLLSSVCLCAWVPSSAPQLG